MLRHGEYRLLRRVGLRYRVGFRNDLGPGANAFVRLFNADTPFAIELVAGRSVEDIVRRGVSYYHLCDEADDIDAAIAQAVKLGAIRVRPPKPAVLFGGRLVAFVFTPLGLIEFLERA